jgi:hypothetical protein
MAEKTSKINRSNWHAVAIRPKGINSCDAVQACRNTRFLSTDAPRLALPECTNSDTGSCGYKHHADRRGSVRRAEERDGLRRSSEIGQNRRLTRDRRKLD